MQFLISAGLCTLRFSYSCMHLYVLEWCVCLSAPQSTRGEGNIRIWVHFSVYASVCGMNSVISQLLMNLCVCLYFQRSVHLWTFLCAHLSLCVSVPVLVCLLTPGHIPWGVCVYLVWECTVCVVCARVVYALGVLLLWHGMSVFSVCVWIMCDVAVVWVCIRWEGSEAQLIMRSGWGRRDGSVWRRGGAEETLSLSTVPRKEIGVGWGSISALR